MGNLAQDKIVNKNLLLFGIYRNLFYQYIVGWQLFIDETTVTHFKKLRTRLDRWVSPSKANEWTNFTIRLKTLENKNRNLYIILFCEGGLKSLYDEVIFAVDDFFD